MSGMLDNIPPPIRAQWPELDDENPTRRDYMPAFAGVLVVATVLMVAARLFLRAKKRAGSLGLDDAILSAACIVAVAHSSLAIVGSIQCGLDRHLWDIHPNDYEDLAWLIWSTRITYTVGICLVKVSVMLFYRRLTERTVSRAWKWGTLFAIGFTVTYTIAFLLVLIFSCNPVPSYWQALNPNYTGNHYCADTRAMKPVMGVLNLASDLYAVVLPIAMLWQMKADKREKMKVNAVFALGLTVVAAGAVRTYYLMDVGEKFDISWNFFMVFVWAQLEINLGIMFASVPAVRVLFRRYMKPHISKAVQSASNSSSVFRSAERKARRDLTSTTNCSKSFDSSADIELGEKTLIKHSVRKSQSLDTVRENDLESVNSYDRVVRRTDELEVYSSPNNHHNAPSYPRPAYGRENSGYDVGHFDYPRPNHARYDSTGRTSLGRDSSQVYSGRFQRGRTNSGSAYSHWQRPMSPPP